MATKIEKLFEVSGNELYTKRNKLIADQFKAEIEDRKAKINKELNSIEFEEIQLLDIGKVSNDSLVPNLTAAPAQFIDKLIALDLRKETVQLEKESIDRVISIYFTDENETQDVQ